jgi:DNA polymerase III subunit alpha
MPQNHFTHLHLHTEFSLLDGAIQIDKLVEFGKKNNFKALAITDHGNIFGAVKFFQKCKKAGIKPILGMEAYFTEDVTIKTVDRKYYHLILLVQNEIGYKNLCKLISFAYQSGFYFKPRIDYAILQKYSEGLIVTSACLGGHIPTLLMNNQMDEARERLEWFLTVFGRERFYLEVQPEDQKDQTTLNTKLYELSKQYDVKLVASGDCHYIHAEDREAHEVMLAIQTQHKITDPDRFTFGQARVHIRTEAEMLALFPNHPEAIWNSGTIADSCNFDFKTGKLYFPEFQIPNHHTTETYFAELCNQGLHTLIEKGIIAQEKQQEYWDRLNFECALIIKMGFVGYFLVVSDFIQWAKRSGIPVGPGRGSAAGSLVAWSLQITNIDPLKYNLLFERFLNPERISMPDIDIDFCIEGRDAVINYVREKYGHDRVGQIITFGTMMAKGVIKDVARALGMPFEDSNAISAMIPDQLKITLKEAIEQEPKLKELIEHNIQVSKVFDIAFRLEGVTRHASKHAAGIVISPEPIDEVLPVYVPSKSTELVTQYAMTELETLGFLKIDLLGLKNLTLIERALQLIKKNHGISINLDTLPLDDPKTFHLICQGKTSGVFQLESNGLKEVLQKLQPEKFEDIIAVNALYRPGPLGSGMVDDFIERKQGRQKIVYLFPELKPILEETYGVIVYQEQVLKIAATIGGYSLGEADILRKAMGKKKAEVMAEQRAIFLQKATENKFEAKKAGELFDLVAFFAGYGFNKAHSAAYALIAYQTAYLKANYLPEFMACLISLESANAENMTFYLQEAKDMGLNILPPTINQSDIDFSIVDGSLLFGLRGIKSVGLASLDNIINERKKAPFSDLFDFCKRIDLRTSNKRVIENLICAGAFDSLPGNRAQKYDELPKVMEQAAVKKKNEETGQMGLFDITASSTTSSQDFYYNFSPRSEWDNKTKLDKEEEVIGFYLSAHPMDMYKKYLKWFNIRSFSQSLEHGLALNSMQEPVVIGCGLLKTSKVIITKKGEKMAFATLEDHNSSAEIVLFPKTYAQVEKWLTLYNVFIVKGSLDISSQQKCKIKANSMVPLDLIFEEWPQWEKIALELPPDFNEIMLQQLNQKLVQGLTPLHFIFHENGKKLYLKSPKKITIDTQFIQEVERQNFGIQIKL